MAALTMYECGLDTCPVPGGFVITTPHLPGNIILLISFGLTIPINVYFGVRHSTPLYTLLFIAGILLEILGHVGNILLRDNIASRQFFTMYMVGSVTGPTFITAAIYVVLPHILSVYGSSFCRIPSPLWLGLLFFGFDVFTLAFQIVGCVFTVDGISRPKMGQGVNILLAGLSIQVTGLLLYFGVYFAFAARTTKHRALVEEKHAHVYLSHRFRIFLLCLQFATALIILRTIAKIVQISGGIASDLFQSQTLSLVLDSAVVLLASVILTATPPGVAFGTRAWGQTAPHMVGVSFDDTFTHNDSRNGQNYSLQSHNDASQSVQAPYHSTPYQEVIPPRGQQARGYGGQVPAYYQFPNLQKSTPKPQPIRVAPYKPDEHYGGDKATSSARLMQPGSAGSQTSPLSNSHVGSDTRGSKRYSPRQVDMVDDEALWG